MICMFILREKLYNSTLTQKHKLWHCMYTYYIPKKETTDGGREVEVEREGGREVREGGREGGNTEVPARDTPIYHADYVSCISPCHERI